MCPRSFPSYPVYFSHLSLPFPCVFYVFSLGLVPSAVALGPRAVTLCMRVACCTSPLSVVSRGELGFIPCAHFFPPLLQPLPPLAATLLLLFGRCCHRPFSSPPLTRPSFSSPPSPPPPFPFFIEVRCF